MSLSLYNITDDECVELLDEEFDEQVDDSFLDSISVPDYEDDYEGF